MTNKRNLEALWVIPLVGFLVLAALPAHAERPADAPVATMSVHGADASFSPMSFDAMTLTVAGHGHVSVQTARSGQSLSFAPVDDEGYALPDGTYNWEIVTTPDLRSLRASAFSNGKVSADGRTMVAPEAPRGGLQSGVFTVKNGMIVNPDLVEAESSFRVRGMAPVSAELPSPAERRGEHIDQDGDQ